MPAQIRSWQVYFLGQQNRAPNHEQKWQQKFEYFTKKIYGLHHKLILTQKEKARIVLC